MTASDDREFWARAERDLAGPIDSTVPNSARVWNFWLGGKDHYPADELAGEECSARFPDMAGTVRRLRAFTWHAVGFLAGEAGVRQFLDIGVGLPPSYPVHEVAQSTAPECRVVYADNDPLVLAFGQALLTSRPPGSSTCIAADLNEPARLLEAAAQAELDFTKPIAIMLTSVLGHIGDPALGDDQAALSVVTDLKSALPPGGWLVVGDLAATSAGLRAAMASYNAAGADPYHLRSPHQLVRFLAGLDLAGLALTPVTDRPPGSDLAPCAAWGALGRKP